MARIYRISGEQWTGKTTFALSGEGGTWYGELDPGSYDRALSGSNVEGVTLYECHPPINDLLDEGSLSTAAVGQTQSGPIRVVHEMEGYHDALMGLRQAFAKAIMNPAITNLALDTETQLWDLLQDALIERTQKETSVKREKLSSLEYEDLHKQMTSFVMAARIHKKNLIFLCKLTDEWGPSTTGSGRTTTGNRIPDGWERMPGYADIELSFFVRSAKPHATIKKAGGASLALGGMVIEEPTIPKLELLVNCASALRHEGIDLPDDVESILAQGKMLGIKA